MDKALAGISPFFIVSDARTSVGFYRDRLGFEATYQQEDFAVLRRDCAQLFVKAIGDEAPPLPNPGRHPWAKWDAYVSTADPDALAAEFRSRGAAFHAELADTSDGQRGFEIADPDGHVLFFGRPL
jgi:catechol 2,3-dioxygenase-like lactoylglutathione lyase family enzyme